MAVELLSLSCNHCGAPLEVPAGARFVTCAHCNSRLAVQRSGSAYYTSVLDRIEHNTEEAAEDLGVIRLQNDLGRLDREWKEQRQRYCTRGSNGALIEPVGGAGCAIVGGILAIPPILIVTVVLAFIFPPLALLGLLLLTGLAYWAISDNKKNFEAFRKAKAQYLCHRHRLISELERRESRIEKTLP